MNCTNQRQQKCQRTRKKIIGATLEILGKEGREFLTTRRLIKKAGVGKGTIYHHFKDMDHLIIECLEYFHIKTMSSFEEKKFYSLEEYLIALGGLSLKILEDEKTLVRSLFSFMEHAFYSKDMKKHFFAMYESILLYFADKILLHSANKHIPKERIDVSLKIIAALIDGLQLHSVIYKNPGSFLHAWNNFVPVIVAFIEGDIKTFERSLNCQTNN